MSSPRAPRRVRLLVNGLGRVGQAFIELVLARADELASEFDVRPEVIGVATRRAVWSAAVAHGSSSPSSVLARVRAGEGLAGLPGTIDGRDGQWAIENLDADGLVEAIPSDLRRGEPEGGHIRSALERGWHVVTAAKGALANHPELLDLARSVERDLLFGAATAAALPTVDVARYCLAGARISEAKGILNGTSNFVLGEMRAGRPYSDAVRTAQDLGIAEADPAQDVEGWDTAAKLVLIANYLWGCRLRLPDVAVSGITALTQQDMERASANGRIIKLVGTARQDAAVVRAWVEPMGLDSDDPIAHVRGAEKAMTFTTDTMDRVTVSGGRSTPTGAAAALLRDVLHLSDGPDRPHARG